MRFGKFLSQRQIVSAAEVLEALAEQARRRTYLPLLLATVGVISAERALDSGSTTLRNDEEILAECYRRGVLSARDYHQIELQWRASAPPIGELLVERGKLSLSELKSLLADFRLEAPYAERGFVALR